MNHKEERQLIMLTKIIGVLLIILIIVDFMSCIHAKAGVVTGEKHLGGMALVRQQVVEKGEELPEYEEINLLAEVMFWENWSTDKEHEAARLTGAVVLNRVKHKWFPDTVKGVLYQKGQYATTHKFFTKELPEECYKLAIDLYRYGTDDVPLNVIFQSTHKEFGSGVWKCINGEYFNYE